MELRRVMSAASKFGFSYIKDFGGDFLKGYTKDSAFNAQKEA